jgi:hypothetical protein
MALHVPIVLFALFALMVSCTTTDYLGKTYPPTQHSEGHRLPPAMIPIFST